MKLYLAAPLFTAAENAFNADLATMLRCAGHEVYVPQEIDQRLDKRRIFVLNVSALSLAEAVVAVVDGSDVDSGTAWECGYAFAQGKTIYGLRTDFRILGEGEPINLQIGEGLRLYDNVKYILRDLKMLEQPA